MNFSIPSLSTKGYPRRSDLKSKVQWSDLIVAISEMVAGQLRLPRLQQGQQPHISALPWTQEAIFTTLDHYHANLQNNNQNIVQTVRHYGAQKHIPGKYTFEKNFEFNLNKLCTNIFSKHAQLSSDTLFNDVNGIYLVFQFQFNTTKNRSFNLVQFVST